jgi:hypothetical protein
MIEQPAQDRHVSRRLMFTLRGLIIYVTAWGIAIATYVPFARHLDLPWWSIVAVAVGGAFIGVFSGHRGRILNLSIGIWASVIAVFALPVLGLVGVLLLGHFTFSSDFEMRGVSYSRYQRRVDCSELDPRGGTEIYFSEESRKDYRISFWRMLIDRHDYQRLLEGRKQALSAELPTCLLQETILDSLAVSEFTAHYPDWWKLPQHEAQLSVHELRCDDGRGIKTYVRGVWIYDEDTSILWIVEK